MEVCAKITVMGVVQGVGFRYYAYREAHSFGIKGYVKNLYDGSVETEVEGDKAYVDAYISSMRRGPSYSHVTNVHVDWCKFENKYKSFNIR